MNKVTLIARMVSDPTIKYKDDLCIARYRLAVDRRGKDAGTDFINCVAFGKGGEFAEKYLKKGMKIAVNGRIQTGSYDDKNGNKVYTFEVVVEEHEFCEGKKDSEKSDAPGEFKDVGIEEELPFV